MVKMLIRTAMFSGALVLSSTAGCAESGVGAPARGPNPAAVSANLALDLRNPNDARESLFGDAVLFTAPGRGLALALDGGTAPGMQDGYVDQVFLLQQQEPTRVDPRTLRSAELFFAGRLLMARSAGTTPLMLVVQGPGDPEPAVDRLPFSTAGAERFSGFGLSRRTGAWQVPLDEVAGTRMTSLLPACAGGGGIGVASACDSGGEGSTSCSTACSNITGGSCSTSCGSGYYSCCDKGACSCTCVAGGGGANPKPPINVTSVRPGRRDP